MTATDHTLELHVTEEEFGLTIHVPRDILVQNAGETSAAVIAAWEQKARPRRLVLDLSAVQHIDSSGVGALMEIGQHLNQANTRLIITGLQEGPRRLLERTGIARLFDIRDRAEETSILAAGGRRQRRAQSEEALPRKRSRRALWALLWFCALLGGMTAIGIASYPTLQRYHAQLEQIPILRGFVNTVDQRVAAVEQNMKDQFGVLESRLTGHIRAERRQQAEQARRTAELKTRLDALEDAQRTNDARINDLAQKLEQPSSSKEENDR
jgi:anti-anti-sigma factor